MPANTVEPMWWSKMNAWPLDRNRLGNMNSVMDISQLHGVDEEDRLTDGPVPGSTAVILTQQAAENRVLNPFVPVDTTFWTGVSRVTYATAGVSGWQNGPAIPRVAITGAGIHTVTFQFEAIIGQPHNVRIVSLNKGPGTVRRRVKHNGVYVGSNTVLSVNSTSGNVFITEVTAVANPDTITIEYSEGTAGAFVVIGDALVHRTNNFNNPGSGLSGSTWVVPDLNNTTGLIQSPWVWTGAANASRALRPGEGATDHSLLLDPTPTGSWDVDWTLLHRIAPGGIGQSLISYILDNGSVFEIYIYQDPAWKGMDFFVKPSFSTSGEWISMSGWPAALESAEWWNVAAMWDVSEERIVVKANDTILVNEVVTDYVFPSNHGSGGFSFLSMNGDEPSKRAGFVIYTGEILTQAEQDWLFAQPTWDYPTLSGVPFFPTAPVLGGVSVEAGLAATFAVTLDAATDGGTFAVAMENGDG